MPQQIQINSSHYNASTNKFSYPFPIPQVLKNKEVGVASISVFNSFFNVTSAYANNTISLVWNADTTTTYTFVIPNQFLDATGMNFYLQQQMVAQGLYATVSSASDNIYFLSIAENSTSYAIEIDVTPLPTSAQATALGYSIGTGATWNWPSSPVSPELTISKNFGNLIGFVAGTYPPTPSTSAFQMLSSFCPEISVVNSIVVACSLVSSFGISLQPDIIYSIGIGDNAFGSAITANAGSVIYSDVVPMTYSTIDISFYDQNLNRLTLKDSSINLTLSIRDKVVGN